MPFGVPQTNLSQFAAQNGPAQSGMGPQFQAPAAESGEQNAWAQNLVQTNGNPQGGVFSQPGQFGNPAAPTPATPAPSTPTNPFANPSFRTDLSGYNPSQYATTDTANNLAQQLGGSVNQTRNANGSPIGPPPQNMIDFGGADMLNAGLLAERYAKYDRATADAMTRAELAQMGPRSSGMGEGEEGGQFGTNSFYQPVSGGQNFLGQGENMGSAVGSGPRIAERGGTTPGFNPYTQSPGAQQNFNFAQPRNPFFQNQNHGTGPSLSANGRSPWAARYAQYRPNTQPYGNRRYYPGMGAAPRFQPRQELFQSQIPSAWY